MACLWMLFWSCYLKLGGAFQKRIFMVSKASFGLACWNSHMPPMLCRSQAERKLRLDLEKEGFLGWENCVESWGQEWHDNWIVGSLLFSNHPTSICWFSEVKTSTVTKLKDHRLVQHRRVGPLLVFATLSSGVFLWLKDLPNYQLVGESVKFAGSQCGTSSGPYLSHESSVGVTLLVVIPC